MTFLAVPGYRSTDASPRTLPVLAESLSAAAMAGLRFLAPPVLARTAASGGRHSLALAVASSLLLPVNAAAGAFHPKRKEAGPETQFQQAQSEREECK